MKIIILILYYIHWLFIGLNRHKNKKGAEPITCRLIKVCTPSILTSYSTPLAQARITCSRMDNPKRIKKFVQKTISQEQVALCYYFYMFYAFILSLAKFYKLCVKLLINYSMSVAPCAISCTITPLSRIS